MSTLVLGATGFLGLNLVDALLSHGALVRAARRRRSNVIPLRARKVPLVEVDLDDHGSLVRAMRQTEVVFHVAGHYPKLSNDLHRALQTGLGQLERALDAAAEAGVGRFVYVSSTATVAPSRDLSTEADVFARAPRVGVYHQLKWEMEARALAEDRLSVAVACPSGCIGPWDLRIGTSALLLATLRGMQPAHPDGVVNLVDVRDVAEGLVALARSDLRRVLLSSSTHSLHALLELVSQRFGVAPPSPALPDAAALAFADAEEARAAREGGRPLLSREIVDLVLHGVPIDGSLAERALDLRYRSLVSSLDDFEDWASRMGFVDRRRRSVGAER